MAELQVDKTEIGLIMMGLNSLDDARLTEDGKAARARLALKLGEAHADLFVAARLACPTEARFADGRVPCTLPRGHEEPHTYGDTLLLFEDETDDAP